MRGNGKAGDYFFKVARISQNFSFGKSTLDLWEKAGFKPLFPEPFPKLTEIWERL
jgi:hypothetical protein